MFVKNCQQFECTQTHEHTHTHTHTCGLPRELHKSVSESCPVKAENRDA